MRRTVFAVLALLFLLPLTGQAQEQGTFSGHYSTIRMSTDTLTVPEGPTVVQNTYRTVPEGPIVVQNTYRTVPEGPKVVQNTYRISIFADDPGSPFNQTVGHCMQTLVLGSDGTLMAAGGGCHISDTEGSGYWHWWQMDEAGTESCPIMCGSYGDYNGYGKFAGLSGGGTFMGTASFPDGSSMGTVEGTYEIG